jgi:hypothetical protein
LNAFSGAFIEMASPRASTLKEQAAAWEAQSKIEGHSEQARKMQNENIQKGFSDIKSKLAAIETKYEAIIKAYQDEKLKTQTDYNEKLGKINEKITELMKTAKEVAAKQKLLPNPPTLNSARNLVNKTLKNKNNNTKLQLLGNLAGKSSLFSKKQERIAKGRNALIQKQYNLSRKNYEMSFQKQADALQQKQNEIDKTIRQYEDQRYYLERNFIDIPEFIETKYRKQLQALYREFLPIISEAENFHALHKNTVNSSFNTSLTNTVLNVGDSVGKLHKILNAYAPRVQQQTYYYVQPSEYVNVGYGRRQRRNSYEAGQWLAQQKALARRRRNSGNNLYDPGAATWGQHY